MFVVKENDSYLDIELSSESTLIDRLVEHLKSFSGYSDEKQIFGLRIVTRELVANAIEHGNLLDSNKKVNVHIEKIPNNRLKMFIRDEGPGVSPKQIQLAMKVDEKVPRSRGLPLANRYSDEIKFEVGCVIVWYTPPHGGEVEIEYDEDECIVKANGGITSANGENFRKKILEVYSQKPKKIIIDCANIIEIDSIGISVLLSFANMVNKKNEVETQLVISGVSGDLQLLLNFTRTDRVYEIVGA